MPFRKALVRGLAISMPPLLTLVLFLWAWNIIDSYVLRPVEATFRYAIVWSIADIREDRDVMEEWAAAGQPGDRMQLLSAPPSYRAEDGTTLVKVNQQWIPKLVFDVASASPGEKRPDTAEAVYHRYVQVEFLPRHLVIPAFLSVFILALYLLGRLFAFGIGRWIWTYLESIIGRLPIVSNVYSSVKQVTDFAFSENEIQFTRVVAVEYPRKGIWTIGFVTGESMLDIRVAANEPVVSVLMPTSPMPATGFVISVPKSETIDLDITMDQAIQWCVSCGVVVPNHQQSKTIAAGQVPVGLPGEVAEEIKRKTELESKLTEPTRPPLPPVQGDD